MSERLPEAPPGDRPPPPTAAPSQPPPPLQPSPGRRLARRTDDRVIAGVASGIAAALGIHPWVVRLGFVVLTAFGGFGVMAYLVGWLLVPAAGSDQSIAAGLVRRPGGLRTTLGVALVLVAVAILASAFSEPGVIWAFALIAFGIFLLRQDPEPTGPPPAGAGLAPPAGTTGATTTATTPVTGPSPTAPTEPLPWAPPSHPAPPTREDLPVWPPPPPPDQATAWGAPPPRPPRRRPFLGPVTIAVSLIVVGLALALDNLGLVDLSLGQVLALFLTVIGAGLLVGAWWGRAWGLIPVGLLALPVVAAVALAGPVPVEGGFAERRFQPRTPAEVRSSYRLAGGELILDLSAVGFPPGQPPIRASVAGGRLLVVLPDEVAAQVRGRLGAGSLELLGHEDIGAQIDATVTAPAVARPARGAAPTVGLDLQAGYGVIEVRRERDPRPLDQVGPFGDDLDRPAAPTATTASPEGP